MIRNHKLTVFAVLVSLVAGTGVLAAGEPLAPRNNTVYRCDGWDSIVFHLPTSRPLRCGTSDIKEKNKAVDTKKTTLAFQNVGPFWEFTINPGGGQCQDVKVRPRPRRGIEKVIFDNCRGGMPKQTCWRKL